MNLPLISEPPFLPEVVERITRQFEPLRIILFGSWARGQAHSDSDLDLLVVLSHIENKRQTTIHIGNALSDLPVSKDIVVTTPEEIAARGHLVGQVLRQALREGKTIYERPEAKRWLAYAHSDLEAASTLLRDPEHYPRQLCFLAQQAAEKALKAVLVWLEIEFPRTHDLDRLREMVLLAGR